MIHCSCCLYTDMTLPHAPTMSSLQLSHCVFQFKNRFLTFESWEAVTSSLHPVFDWLRSVTASDLCILSVKSVGLNGYWWITSQLNVLHLLFSKSIIYQLVILASVKLVLTWKKNCLISSSDVLDTEGRPCEQYKVVALGTGRSSCSKWLCYNGTMVHDCHAVVIARRALLRYKHERRKTSGESRLLDNNTFDSYFW